MIGRLTFAIAALAATAGLVHAADRHETLTVLRDCPAKGWHRACLEIAFFFRDDHSGRLRTRHVDDGSWSGSDVLDHLLVKGSLLEGRGQGTYRLKLDYPVSKSEADSPDELGALAFVGRSLAGRPIVLTDRGPLEIATPSVEFESTVDLYVFNEKTGRLVAQLINGQGPFVVTKGGEIGVWDARRAICIKAATVATRDLPIITTACKIAGVSENGGRVQGVAVEATDIDFARAMELVGTEASTFDAYRAPGLGLILIWANWQYCC